MLKTLKRWGAAFGRWCEFADATPELSKPLEAWRPAPPEARHKLQMLLDHVVQRRALAASDNEDVQTSFFEIAEQMHARGLKPKLISGPTAKNGWLKSQLKSIEQTVRVSYIRHFLSHPENAGCIWSPKERREFFLNFSEVHDRDEGITTEELLEDANQSIDWGLQNLRDRGLVVTMQVVRPE